MSGAREVFRSYDEFLQLYRTHLERDASNAHGGLNGDSFIEELTAFGPRYRASTAALLFYQGAQFHRLAVIQELTTQYARMIERPLNDLAIAKYFVPPIRFSSVIDAAENLYLLSIALDPEWSPSHFNLGIILFRRGQREQARGEFSLVNPTTGKLASYAQWYLAMIAEDEGQYEQASYHYQRALTDGSHFGPMHRRAADVFRRTGKLKDALKHYQRALEFSYPPAPEFLFVDFVESSEPTKSSDRLRELMKSKGLFARAAQPTDE